MRTPTKHCTSAPRLHRPGPEYEPGKRRVARNFCSSHVDGRNPSVRPLHTTSSRDPSDDYIYGPGNVPIEQVSQSSGAATYLYTDQLGSVVMEADQSGNVTGTQSYSPYGSLASSTGTWLTPFGFAGGYTEPTGLIYLVNRYYDPATGQFLSVDPALQSTQQPYSYANGDPLNAVDPSGLSIAVGGHLLPGNPSEGEFPFIPRKNECQPKKRLKDGNYGYVDAKGNVWYWDKVHQDHWDVTGPTVERVYGKDHIGVTEGGRILRLSLPAVPSGNPNIPPPPNLQQIEDFGWEVVGLAFVVLVAGAIILSPAGV